MFSSSFDLKHVGDGEDIFIALLSAKAIDFPEFPEKLVRDSAKKVEEDSDCLEYV